MDTVISFFDSKPDFSELAHVSTYRLWGPGGRIKVKLNDFGEGAGEGRYLAYAQYADTQGRPEIVVSTYGASLGEPSATVEAALESVDWAVFQELDPA
jgi:hypothetical protein